MPWPGPQLRLILLLLILAILGPPGIVAEGNVGCLFSERICLEEEWCFDDEAFGRCLPKVGDLNEDDFFRYNLQQEALHDFSKEIRRLFALGYRWGHAYTQCRLQGMLFTLKNQLEYELDSCSHLSDNDLEGALRALEGQVQLDPQEVAIIKYTPSVDNPHADFADEVYYPPVDNKQQEEIRRNILGVGEAIDLDMPDPLMNYGVTKRTWLPPMRRRSITPFFDGRYGVPKYRRIDKEPLDSIEFLHEYENEYPEPKPPEYRTPLAMVENEQDFPEEEMYPLIKLLHQLQLPPKDIQQYLSPSNYNKLRKILNRYKQMTEDEPPDDVLINELMRQKFGAPEDDSQDFGPDERFTLTYNTPDKFREGWESRDEVIGDELPEPRIYFDEEQDPQSAINTEYGSGHPDEIFSERNLEFLKPREVFRELKQRQEQENEDFNKKWKSKPVVYSEGGAEPEDIGELENQQEIALRDDLNIWDRYNMGFKRPERLDVKKPGPPFDPAITDITQRALGPHHYSQNRIIPSMMKKEPRGPHPNPNSNYVNPGKREGGDDQYVHIEFKEILRDWKQGKDIIKNIFNLLHMEQTDYIDGQVHMQSVSFSVANNSRGYNASEVARKIELIKDDLENLTGVEVVSAGLGNKAKMQNVLFTRINPESQYIVIFLVCGVLVALILATIVLTLIRKHIKFRDKLKGLSRPDTEASKDYQDLCRARMATKGQTTEGAPDKGRITSLSRESEQSPSSRSSTSSWSEEPALHNMDISTGHMVLSYMEDHLKNKDRLDQEWIALCAYVAEPCETSIAMKKDNVEKNRYREVVPYDHARVILNELTNSNGSDYINASSITDHDPRNPAYIATQGPLPHTAADFWQLIWEQGAVVIVMLTRLTEGGTAMCHRYWPEEGSEVYHIYEVHLVSEHIWCDDYLVRSFYLKNVRTGETRTVTQFHFLSWPEAGVPGSTKALLEFRRKVNKSYRGRSCPIVVHCSDGAGRTGTYCLIDMVLSRMAKGAKEIDIAATLEHLRDQRPKMVATKQQFEFVLTAVAEEVHAILKALPPQPSPAPQTTQEKPEK